ncbi:MAG TPA: hypothetical protein PKD85_20435 [Saprospiraceae bacterium]|nr:hypothetical protein [Saprospiraceae bacterium]
MINSIKNNAILKRVNSYRNKRAKLTQFDNDKDLSTVPPSSKNDLSNIQEGLIIIGLTVVLLALSWYIFLG